MKHKPYEYATTYETIGPNDAVIGSVEVLYVYTVEFGEPMVWGATPETSDPGSGDTLEIEKVMIEISAGVWVDSAEQQGFEARQLHETLMEWPDMNDDLSENMLLHAHEIEADRDAAAEDRMIQEAQDRERLET